MLKDVRQLCVICVFNVINMILRIWCQRFYEAFNVKIVLHQLAGVRFVAEGIELRLFVAECTLYSLFMVFMCSFVYLYVVSTV